MRIHHLRNATLILELGAQRLLVDPMLGDVGSGVAFRFFRGKRRKNPIVPLPAGTNDALCGVTAALITHRHPDHLDAAAIAWLVEQKIPVYAHAQDLDALRKEGLDATDFLLAAPSLGMEARAIPTLHGYGMVGWLMGKGTGWYLRASGAGVYLTGDTVLIDAVRTAIFELRPEVIVAPAGVANFGVLSDLLFPEEELLDLAEMAPGRVVFNHQEALDHCLYTREQLRRALETRRLLDKCSIPEDGEELEL